MGVDHLLALAYRLSSRLEPVSFSSAELSRLRDKLILLKLAAMILWLEFLAIDLGGLVLITALPGRDMASRGPCEREQAQPLDM